MTSFTAKKVTVEELLKGKRMAHVREQDGTEHTLIDHLTAVSKICGAFAEVIGLRLAGNLTGLVHDTGKYSDTFARYLLSGVGLINPSHPLYLDPVANKGKIDHSTSGGQLIIRMLGQKDPKKRVVGISMFLAIAGHHGGLMDCIDCEGKDVLSERINKPDDRVFYTECLDRIRQEEPEFLKKVTEIIENPDFVNSVYSKIISITSNPNSEIVKRFEFGLLLRFLLSCLIDADRIDTADFEKVINRRFRQYGHYIKWNVLRDRLERELKAFEVKAEGSTEINRQRKKISDDCLKAAERVIGVYTLTSPTGSGKLLASLRFAISHAIRHGLSKIFYILPFTAIIDQNAQEVRKRLEFPGDGSRVVLEHHSNLAIPDDRQSRFEGWRNSVLSQNYDAPLVFITMVQFLEACFGSRSDNTRRFHEFAKSVIIFDEVQQVPLQCIHMFNNVLNFLHETCGCSILLCTATLPLLDQVNSKFGAAKLSKNPEIVLDVTSCFDKIKRVDVVDNRKPGGWRLGEVVDLMNEQLKTANSLLTVVNTKKACYSLYSAAKLSLGPNVKVFHLSTNMCAAHRRNVIRRIKNRNPKAKIVCVSTQLIEAGVDIDFDVVIRSLAGLDSIAQAAGRCNRHDKKKGQRGLLVIINVEFENIPSVLMIIKVGQIQASRVLDEFKRDPQRFDNDILGRKMVHLFFTYFLGYFNQEGRETLQYPIRRRNVDADTTRKVRVVRDDTLINILSCNVHAVAAHQNEYHKHPDPHFRQSFAYGRKRFASIVKRTRGVIVPYSKGRELIRSIKKATTIKEQNKLLFHAQKYSVNLELEDFRKLHRQGALRTIIKGTSVVALKPGWYDRNAGIVKE